MTRIEYNGMTFSDEQDEIISGEIYNAVSLISDVIEVGTFNAEVRVSSDTDGENLRNFKRNDKLICFHNDRQLGVWYVENVERTSKYTYEISANNSVALLDGSKHYGGIYTGQTAGEVIADICTISHHVKPALAEQKLYGWLPAASRRSNLAQVLFAIGAYTWVDETGLLRIDTLWDGVSNYIGEDSIMTGDKVKYASKITAVSVLEHQYVKGTDDVTLFEGTSSDGDIITFNEPAHSLAASGVTILESGANYVKISAGTGTVTGKKYIHTTRDIRRSVSESDVESVKEVKNATLVSLTNSMAVAQRLAEYYKCCETVQHEAIFHNQTPGDVINFDHPFDGDSTGCIKSTGIKIGCQKIVSDESIVCGFLPLRLDDVEYYDKREVISESGTFTVPEGVTTIRAVIIGGGSGGQAGSDGENGTSGGDAYVAAGSATESVGTAGSGGYGGGAGIGGLSGKISVIDLSVKSGDVLSIQTGVGGQGGSENGVQGESGTDTTVELNGEAFSSADGSASPTGYIDTVTGEVYAETGIAGVNGGNGGDSLKQNTPAEDGDPVGENSGGIAGTNSISSSSNSKVVFDSYTTSKTTKTSTTSAGWTEGYSSYKQDAEGRLSAAGSLTYAGTKNGVFKSGPVYYDFTNSSAPSYAGSVNSSMNSRSASGSSSSWTETTITQTNSRKYVKKTMQVSKGTLASGGGGAAFGANGDGISGGSAIKPEFPTRLGCGGNGGHGGGGGGGGGSGYVYTSGDVSNFTSSYSASGLSGGSAGKGSAGSDGANGGVILYFGVPHIIPHGSVMEKTGRFVLDRTGRLMVV